MGSVYTRKPTSIRRLYSDVISDGAALIHGPPAFFAGKRGIYSEAHPLIEAEGLIYAEAHLITSRHLRGSPPSARMRCLNRYLERKKGRSVCQKPREVGFCVYSDLNR